MADNTRGRGDGRRSLTKSVPDNMNTKRVTCACGRWWIVYPILGLCVSLTLWLATQWPPAREQVTYTLFPGIWIFFTTAFLFREASANLELRGIGMSMLAVAIGVMAFHGVGLSIGLTTAEKTERILGISFYGSAAGLTLMAVYFSIVGVKALRTRPDNWSNQRRT
jgi:hypothetical protein